MATKSKPVERAEPAPSGKPAPRRAGPVRYSISKADLRERGLYEERRGIPLPNVADLMGYILKGMVIFLIFTAVRGIWQQDETRSSDAIEARPSSPQPGSRNNGGPSGVKKHLDTLTDAANAATDWFADLLREIFYNDHPGPISSRAATVRRSPPLSDGSALQALDRA